MTDSALAARKYRGGCLPGLACGTAGRPGCRLSCGHRAIVEEYRDARRAWEDRRESDEPAYGAAGASGSGAACYQLSDEEYAELYPPPLFKDFLVGRRGANRDPEE